MSDETIDKGYGIVRRAVLRDPELSIESKAIYSLLCAYAGTSGSCFPDVKTLCQDLHISKTRFYKNINALVSAGIIRKTARTKNGLRVGTNYEVLDLRNSTIYGIPQNEDADVLKTGTPRCPQNRDTDNKQLILTENNNSYIKQKNNKQENMKHSAYDFDLNKED